MPHASPNLKPTFLRWRIVAMLSGIVFLAHFNRVSISVAANAHFIGPDKLSEEQMGLVYSAFLLVYTVAMLPGGWLIDRIGPRRALTGMGLGLGFWAAMTGILGWANSSIAALFVPLLAIRALAGLTGVPLHPGAARSVSHWVPVPERAFANGVVTAGALFGIALTYRTASGRPGLCAGEYRRKRNRNARPDHHADPGPSFRLELGDLRGLPHLRDRRHSLAGNRRNSAFAP